MKRILIVLTVLVAALGLSLGVVMFSNNSYPTQALYPLDRAVESWQLRVYQMLGHTQYAKLNLQLAKERLSEIKMYKASKSKTSLLLKSYAQTADASTVNDDVVNGLIEDFNNNLKEVLNAFNGLKQDTDKTQTIELAKEIANDSTEFGSDILDILPDLQDSEKSNVDESSSLIEDLDDDATEQLILGTEDNNGADDNEVKVLSIEKVSKKILKATEKLNGLVGEFEGKKKSKDLTQQQIDQTTVIITTINADLAEAKTALESGDLTTAYNKAKDAMGLIEQGKNALEDSNSGTEDSQDGTTEDNGKDTKPEDSNDNSNEDNGDDSKSGTVKKPEDNNTEDNSGSDSSNDSNNDTPDTEDSKDSSGSDEVDNNTEDTPDEVKGVSTVNQVKTWIDFTF